MIGYVAGTRGRDSSDRRPIQRVNASTFLHLWIGIGVANHVVRAGSQSRLRLVLRALQTSRNLFGAACSRDLLRLRAADGEWSNIRSRRAYGRASHAAFRIAGNGDESSEREVCYRGAAHLRAGLHLI